MEHRFNLALARDYTSSAQKIRVMTEDWVARHSYCPNCGQKKLGKFVAGKPVADFYCENCCEEYELKSKETKFSSRVVDGAYETMIRRLRASNNPNFLLLNYIKSPMRVSEYFVIPKHFFTPQIIEKRTPLSSAARRAGWVGCSINLDKIPDSGRVYLIRNGHDVPAGAVRRQWKKTLFLREESFVHRGWTIDVMRCVESLGRPAFTLDDVYGCEEKLTAAHPENRHVKDKIRQQLQILRDQGYLIFEGRGKYRLRD